MYYMMSYVALSRQLQQRRGGSEKVGALNCGGRAKGSTAGPLLLPDHVNVVSLH